MQLLHFMLREIFLDDIPINPIGPPAQLAEIPLQCHYGFAEHAFFYAFLPRALHTCLSPMMIKM
jgi:hypothetical protein